MRTYTVGGLRVSPVKPPLPSTMEVAPAVFSAYTSASASVSRPSASVLFTGK
jgi:hypothetical protein